MALSDDVAELERRCQELERQVEGMTDDPVVDYVSLYSSAEGVEIAYGIKAWDWDDEYPRILLSEAVRDEIKVARQFPDDAEQERQNLFALLAAFQKHVDVIKAALDEWGAPTESAK